MWHPPFSTYNTHSSPLSTYLHNSPPIPIYFDNLSQQSFRKLFNCFTAAVSVQHQPFYHFSLVKNRPEGPPLRRLLKFHEIIRIRIHIRVRLNFHVHLYTYTFIYTFHVHILYTFLCTFPSLIYLHILMLAFFRFRFSFYIRIRLPLRLSVSPFLLRFTNLFTYTFISMAAALVITYTFLC